MSKKILSLDWDYFTGDVTGGRFKGTGPCTWGSKKRCKIKCGFSPTLKGLRSLGSHQKGKPTWNIDNLTDEFLNNIFCTKTFVAECHAEIYQLIDPKVDIVINFDHHHDDYGNTDTWNKKDLDCGNWVSLLKSKVSEWDSPEAIASFYSWRRSRKNPDIQDCLNPDLIFICKSEPWTPKKDDDKFYKFVNNISRNTPIFIGVEKRRLEKEYKLATIWN